MSDDRRHAPRRALGDFVTAAWRGDTRLFLGCDLSETGVFLRSTGENVRRLAASSDPVELRFELPGLGEGFAVARVSRRGLGADGHGAALRFEHVPDSTRAALQAFLAA